MRKLVRNIIRFVKTDETPYDAASLSFFTIFAIVPAFLILISVLTYLLGVEKTVTEVQEFVFKLLIPTHRSVIEEYINAFFANYAKTGYVGLVYVLVTSMMFFQNYEYVVNRIFKTKNRSFLTISVTFLLLTVISPFALVFSMMLTAEFQKALGLFGAAGVVNPSKMLPFLIIWLLFFVNYKFSPNRPMHFKPVLAASLLAAVVWYLGKNLFVYYILYNTTYTTIYGSLSVMITFFLWVYISWMIFLYGLELARFLELREEEKRAAEPNSSDFGNNTPGTAEK